VFQPIRPIRTTSSRVLRRNDVLRHLAPCPPTRHFPSMRAPASKRGATRPPAPVLPPVLLRQDPSGAALRGVCWVVAGRPPIFSPFLRTGLTATRPLFAPIMGKAPPAGNSCIWDATWNPSFLESVLGAPLHRSAGDGTGSNPMKDPFTDSDAMLAKSLIFGPPTNG
jgi:hypothetical protein